MAENAADTNQATESAEAISEPVKKTRKPRVKKAEAPAAPKPRGRPRKPESEKVNSRENKGSAVFLCDIPSLDVIEAFIREQQITKTQFFAMAMNRLRASLGAEQIFPEDRERLLNRTAPRKPRNMEAKVAPSRRGKPSFMAFFDRELLRKHKFLVSQLGISFVEGHMRGVEMLLQEHGIDLAIERPEKPRKGGRKHA